MYGELVAFRDLLDVADTFAEEIGMMLSRNILVQLLMDSNSPFDVVLKRSIISENDDA